VPWSDTDHPQSDFEETSPELRSAISSCTGYNDFKRLELIEEARTHPSALLTEVPSYQRLEWIGDAVLCMAIRTWIYYNIGKGASLERMVEVEAALVSNEVLAFLCVKCGLQHHLNHRDHSLPSRLEDYVWSVRESGDGLWGTDPPKSISDMAEAVIGAIHVDGGFAAGQRACLRFMSPMLDVLLKAQRANKEIRLKHPRKAMQEMAGELLEVNLERGPYFASTSPDIDVLVQGGKWGRTSKDGNSFVGSVGILGSILTGVSDTSEKVARNKVCALAVCTIETNPELCDRLKTCLRRLESAHSHNENALAQKRLLEASAAPRIELESEYHAIV
jgi:dsRNA-specific ribonuclease